ncbi:uracil-DNA glycosylase family protein [Dolichospermum sp. UHCC 0259]|uniref:uracil-DNA glycosylase family protein n=1 Tax=Dolichospermum sp. UHCC 0259 TaxID=2590010 RepID=UPI0014468D7E|nr:uracil-DNA glycosylase family protein [Dolichospermum sp. UHCC 0259]MTJ49095.1 uracil-DNA glycosylase [Dolichospermum sp. UHCC 0259]
MLPQNEKFHNDYYQNSPAIAVDLPSLMELKNDSVNKPTIAIIGQDPLTHNLCQEVEVGTPYGLHHKNSREGDTKLYFEIIYDLLKDLNCRIYLTDVYKMWIKNPNDSKRRSLPEEDQERFIQLLKRELNIINPVGLIIWGRKAEKAVNKINLEIKHKYLPHPSDANRRVLAKIIDGPVTHENKLKFYKESIKTIKKEWGI